ncbi:MAG: 30S ribosomal protein S12 methylthiotransferase RimO, partial [Candidatus Aminicenantes bacterium]|nr:30S ribosomal protein S12 methylthiotransferase RimO [Candidatus Aminicenantes bacterium]
MRNDKIRASFISLGCFKNIVDTEVLGGMLEKKNIKLVSPYEETDWVIINTCGFIRDAKEESIDEILAAFEKKEAGNIKHVAVFGCLIERYYADIQESFKNADILWGVNGMEELADLISKNESKEYKESELFLYNDSHKRIITTTSNSTFIKISEGCNMKCAFCSIPAIRGKFRSRDLNSLIKEAEDYKSRGFNEINLISQNSTYFGKDKGKNSQFPQLLKELSGIGFDWIRVLYLMPEDVDDKMIKAFENPSILPYFDLPFQHVAENVLKKMYRGNGVYKNSELIRKIRDQFGDSVIRSSFIVGFPGEQEGDFEELVSFVEETKIERVGVFGYSDEEETKAFDLKEKIDPEIIEERKEKILDISDKNLEIYNKSIRNTEKSFLPLGPWDNNATIGRISSQSPETDGLTKVEIPFTED